MLLECRPVSFEYTPFAIYRIEGTEKLGEHDSTWLLVKIYFKPTDTQREAISFRRANTEELPSGETLGFCFVETSSHRCHLTNAHRAELVVTTIGEPPQLAGS